MIKKLRKIALGTVAIAAVIVLFATDPEVATHQAQDQVWSQAANAQITPAQQQALKSLGETGYTICTHTTPCRLNPPRALCSGCAPIVNKAILLLGVDLPFGRESPTFIQNVNQLAKMGFDSPQNAKLFLQLDSIALNSSSSHPGNLTLTFPTINRLFTVYNLMKSNNSTGGFTEIATVAMHALGPVSGFDAGGRNITALPNSRDFGDILKFGTLGAGIGCAKGPNSGDFAHIIGWNTKSGSCLGGALGAAVVRLIYK
jgi:hypothetical protein